MKVQTEIINSSKVKLYFEELGKLPCISKIALFHNKKEAEVLKVLEKYTIISYYKNKDIKEIKHNFLDTVSNIKVELKHKY